MIERSQEQFSPEWLRRSLAKIPSTSRYWVAYSGGPDSHALLHALAALRGEMPGIEICAVHVNHGLVAAASEWQIHCADVCRRIDIAYEAIEVDVTRIRGHGIEAAARTARYDALSGVMASGDVMLTAHTQDDQAETLLLQLLRGSGPDGLAAMPARVVFANGWLARPLLGISRSLVHGYTASLTMAPVDDPSNQDQRYARNYLRHEVMPLIRSRWPAASTTFARAASHLAETSQLTKDLANLDLEKARELTSNTLDIPRLMTLSSARRRNVMRAWIRSSGLSLPSTAQAHRLEEDVLQARPDRSPLVTWGNVSVRRFGERLYLVPHDVAPGNEEIFAWDPARTLHLSHGRLSANRRLGRGISVHLLQDAQVSVRFRRGGERCRPAGRAHRQTLKHLFQQYRIPPWERGRIPLIYIEDQLAAVAGLWVCEPFAATPGQSGWDISWELKLLLKKPVAVVDTNGSP